MILSIIIPVFNEEKTIGMLLDKVSKVRLPKNIKKEIIIVDDFSTDTTLEVLGKVRRIQFNLLKHKKNSGKGMAIRTGLSASHGDYVIIQDADLEYNPEYYPNLLKPIIDGEATVVYGTRLKNYPLNLWGEGKTVLPTHLIANRFLTFLTNIIYQSKLTDMETCYKLFNRDILRKMNLKAERFDFEPEITAKILKKGIKIAEVAIKTKPRGYNQGKKIGWIDGLIAIWALIKYRFVD